jgi:hypothetical protein
MGNQRLEQHGEQWHTDQIVSRHAATSVLGMKKGAPKGAQVVVDATLTL